MAQYPIVVIHQDEQGEITVFSDDGVTIFWVDERAPDDRVYEMTRHPIPSGMLHGPVGRHKDGSSADAKAHALVPSPTRTAESRAKAIAKLRLIQQRGETP
jgi:hypothetical protein